MSEPDRAGAVGVLVVDDSRPFRAAAGALVRRTPGFVLVGEAESAEDALARLDVLAPDLVLLDVRMPGLDGPAAAAVIAARAPRVRVFLCSTYLRDDLPPEVASAPVAAYVRKEELTPRLLTELWAQTAAASA